MTGSYDGPERRSGYRADDAPPPPDYHGPERRSGYPPASKQEVAEMRVAQESLDRSVRGLHNQLRTLDATLRDFVPRRELEAAYPTKRDVAEDHDDEAAARRAIAAGLSFGIVVAMQAHDAQVEFCRPVQADGTVGRPTTDTVQFACDVAFPLHNHSDLADPFDLTAANLLGLFLYLALFSWVIAEAVEYRRRQRGRRRG
jgi:hypothetical protein